MTDVLEFACALIFDTSGSLLLQQRDNKPGINHPGMIGLFGGHREEGETFLECAVREIHEEIGYLVVPDRFSHVTTFNSVSGNGHVVEIYQVQDVPLHALVVTEGTLLIVEPDQIEGLMPNLTPSTRVAVRQFLGPSLLRSSEHVSASAVCLALGLIRATSFTHETAVEPIMRSIGSYT